MAGGIAYFGEERDPFLLFPEEVWELILDKVEDSQDAWNLLKAFPQLDASVTLQKKKRFWLFGLIIPHLIPWRESTWIKEKDLLNCRQVCRKWSSAVDGFLEDQPQLRAYQPESHGQVAQPFLSGRFHWSVKAYLNQETEVKKNHFGGTGFAVTDYYYYSDKGGTPVERFLRDMEAHPPGRSPFLSRALSISNSEEDADLDAEGTIDFAEDVLALHRKFGEHVWFYKVNFRWVTLGARYMRENISYLPNLKLLHVVMDDENEDDDAPPPSDASVREFVGQLDRDLPALPFLETLRLEGCPEQFSHFLISRFATQIRRLDLHMDLWRDAYSKLFPNLTEFDIMDWRTPRGGNDLKNLLLSLEAPQLAKLQVKSPIEDDEEHLGSWPFVIEDDVFQWLKRFPNLKFMDLGHGCRARPFIEKGTLDPQKDLAPSLQYLAIQTSFEMNYNFLCCLPSLQHLRLYVSSNPFVIDFSTNPLVKIREEIQTASMYKSNIWELPPKLKTVVLVSAEKWWNLVTDEPIESYSYAFNRERYEFQRRLNNGPAVSSGTDNDALAPLRKDIIDSLQGNFWMNQERGSHETDWDEEFEEDSDLDDWDLDLEDSSDDEEEDDIEEEEEEDFAEADEEEDDGEYDVDNEEIEN